MSVVPTQGDAQEQTESVTERNPSRTPEPRGMKTVRNRPHDLILGIDEDLPEPQDDHATDELGALQQEMGIIQEANSKLEEQMEAARKTISELINTSTVLEEENKSLHEDMARFQDAQEAVLSQSLRLETPMITAIDESTTEIRLELPREELSVFRALNRRLRSIEELRIQEERALAEKRRQFEERIRHLAARRDEFANQLEQLKGQQGRLQKTESMYLRKLQRTEASIDSKQDMLRQLEQKISSANGWMVQFYEKENVRLSDEIIGDTHELEAVQQRVTSLKQEISALQVEIDPLQQALRTEEIGIQQMADERLRFEENALGRICELGSMVSVYLLVQIQPDPSATLSGAK